MILRECDEKIMTATTTAASLVHTRNKGCAPAQKPLLFSHGSPLNKSTAFHFWAFNEHKFQYIVPGEESLGFEQPFLPGRAVGLCGALAFVLVVRCFHTRKMCVLRSAMMSQTSTEH